MPLQFRGRVWKFGDNISTDFMAPGYSGHRGLSEDEEARYCMHSNRPHWAQQVGAGDVVVGGQNFGCGSSRMEAPRNLRLLGISGIVAESFGRIFFRNAISQGLPALACEGITNLIAEGETLQCDIQTGEIVNLTTGRRRTTSPLPETVLRILDAGGVLALLKQEYQTQGRKP